MGDIDGDGFDDFFVGALGYDPVASFGYGAVGIFYGPVTGSIAITGADALIQGSADAQDVGWAVAGGGDLNGDSVPDLLIGDYSAGAAFVVYGPVTGTLTLDDDADTIWYGSSYHAEDAGYSVAMLGDVDGDGVAEALIGTQSTSASGYDGAAYLMVGPSAGTTDLLGAYTIFEPETPGDQAGFRVASAGDMDGDGLTDMLISSRLESSGGTGLGAVYLASDPVSGTVSLADSRAKITNASSSNYLFLARAAGDVDGDGHEDLVLGHSSYDSGKSSNHGGGYLFLGPTSGTVSTTAADAIFVGSDSGDYFGCSVAGGADLDGDGFDDLLFAAQGEDFPASDAGAVYLVYGPTSGTHSAVDADLRFAGVAADDKLGNANQGHHSIDIVGDTDGDGRLDLLLGSSKADVTGTDMGAAYLLTDW